MKPFRPAITGTRHMISAGHHGAAHADFCILEAGGNAVDAGFAAGMCLNVLQSDIVNFAGVSADFFPLHMDVTYAERTRFGQRIAHGMLVLSMASGMVPAAVSTATLASMRSTTARGAPSRWARSTR